MYYKYDKENLKFYRAPITKYKLMIVFITFICVGLCFMIEHSIDEFYEDNIILFNTEAYSNDRLLKELQDLNIKFPHIVYAQSILESSGGKSKLFLENNNLFGMKLAKIRPTTALSNHNGYALYTDWKSSVIDYGFYQAYYLKRITTEDRYFQYLEQNYAEDPEYVNKLKRIINNLKLRK